MSYGSTKYGSLWHGSDSLFGSIVGLPHFSLNTLHATVGLFSSNHLPFWQKTVRKLTTEFFTKKSDDVLVADKPQYFSEFLLTECATLLYNYIPGSPTMHYLCYWNLYWSCVTIQWHSMNCIGEMVSYGKMTVNDCSLVLRSWTIQHLLEGQRKTWKYVKGQERHLNSQLDHSWA